MWANAQTRVPEPTSSLSQRPSGCTKRNQTQQLPQSVSSCKDYGTVPSCCSQCCRWDCASHVDAPQRYRARLPLTARMRYSEPVRRLVVSTGGRVKRQGSTRSWGICRASGLPGNQKWPFRLTEPLFSSHAPRHPVGRDTHRLRARCHECCGRADCHRSVQRQRDRVRERVASTSKSEWDVEGSATPPCRASLRTSV